MDKIKNLVKINTKLYFQKKVLALITFIFPVIFYVFFSFIFTNYESVNKIPIVLIDEDQTEISTAVSESIHQNPSLEVRTMTLDESIKALEYNRIEAVVTLKQGFESNITKNNIEGVIQLLYLDKSVIAPALTDIIASDILSYVTLYKSALTGEGLENELQLEGVFEKVIQKGQLLIEDEHFEMPVITQVVVPESSVVIDNSIMKLLKYQTTIGYSILVLSFVLMISQSHLIENRVLEHRLIQSGYHKFHIFTGNLLSIILIGISISLVQVVTLVIGLSLSLKSALFVTCALFTYVCFLSIMILLISSFIESKIKYQSIITPMIFIMGLLGGAFWSIDLLSDSFKWISYLSPVYWTMSIIQNGLLTIYQNSLTILLFFLSSLVILYLIAYSCYTKKSTI